MGAVNGLLTGRRKPGRNRLAGPRWRSAELTAGARRPTCTSPLGSSILTPPPATVQPWEPPVTSDSPMKFDTRVVRAGISPDPTTGSIVPPIYATATYVLEEVGRDKGFD